jgi:hypothetical protein
VAILSHANSNERPTPLVNDARAIVAANRIALTEFQKMPLELAQPQKSVLANYDRRRYQRHELNLLGRYMLENRREYPCRTVNIAPDSAAFDAPISGAIGERVVAYIHQLGRVEGEIIRQMPTGFSMSFNATLRKRDKLAATLAWLVENGPVTETDNRRADRVFAKNPFTFLTMGDGAPVRSRIIDLSHYGASVAVATKPPIGTSVALGPLGARVVRHTEEGVAVEFLLPQTDESLRDYF